MAKPISSKPIPKLIATLDKLKTTLNPLPTSYIADKEDDYLKNVYATMLASVIAAKGIISDDENRLFSLLLTSIGVNKDPNYYINNVNEISEKEAKTFIQGLDTSAKQANFLFEALLLARIHSPINEVQIQLLNETLSFWSLKSQHVEKITFWAEIILGIQTLDKMTDLRKKVQVTTQTEEGLTYVTLHVQKHQIVRPQTVLFKAKSGRSNFQPIAKELMYILDIEKTPEKRVQISYLPIPSFLENWLPTIKDILTRK
jgi:hypothetical protein